MRGRFYWMYRTPGAALFNITVADSKAYYWLGFSIGNVFFGIMWRKPKVDV
jgi:hypothetical protein